MMAAMNIRTGFLGLALVWLSEGPIFAQTLNNQSLTGKYFFRHLALTTDGSSVTNFGDSRSLIGTITFDSTAGRYSFIGQQVVGSGAAASQSGSGAYSVDADRKSTRLNSSHSSISYAVFCLKKKKE